MHNFLIAASFESSILQNISFSFLSFFRTRMRIHDSADIQKKYGANDVNPVFYSRHFTGNKEVRGYTRGYTNDQKPKQPPTNECKWLLSLVGEDGIEPPTSSL